MNYRIFLASNSPRRKDLLSGLGIPFEVRVNGDIDESYPSDLPPEAIHNCTSDLKTFWTFDHSLINNRSVIITKNTNKRFTYHHCSIDIWIKYFLPL